MTPSAPSPTCVPHWWDAPAAAFDAWLAMQSDEVQDMDLLDQIEVYAATLPVAAGGDRG